MSKIDIVVYPGSQIPPTKGQQYCHQEDEWYFAPSNWDSNCPFSPGFPDAESALEAANEFEGRREWV